MRQIQKEKLVICACVGFLVAGGVALFADALATPPQHIRNWEFNSNAQAVLGPVSQTVTNVVLFQTLTNQPGKLPTQSVILTNDGATGSSDVFVRLTIDAPSNANATSNGNGVADIHLVAGDPPLSIDGRYNYASIVRGTQGTNLNQNARIRAVY